MVETDFESLSVEEKELLLSAERELDKAYNPYNNQTKVAAAVRTADGQIIVGVNFNNDSSPSSICAEKAVIVTANSLGQRKLESMAIIGTVMGGGVNEPVTPCGSCRQVMQESSSIAGKDIVVICSNSDKTKILKTSVGELLPMPYGGNWRSIKAVASDV